MTILETDRLILREQTQDDAPFVRELMNTPGWLRYIGQRNIRTDEDARAYIANGAMKSYAQNGYGLWLVELKDGGVPVGACGLLKRDFLDHADIGFAFLQQHAGKGYAYEAAVGVMNYAKDVLGMNTVAAIVTHDNEASIGLIKKLGMVYEGKVKYPGEEEELLMYAIRW
jgi:RimJ/RimL family protein N-acetyltransferase